MDNKEITKQFMDLGFVLTRHVEAGRFTRFFTNSNMSIGTKGARVKISFQPSGVITDIKCNHRRYKDECPYGAFRRFKSMKVFLNKRTLCAILNSEEIAY